MTLADTSETKTAYSIVVATQGDDEGRKFLMVRHKKRGWELPGGKFEGGEGPVHCALREFREETGHLLNAPHFVLKMERENGTCFVFTGRLGARVNEELADAMIDEFAWFDALPARDELAFPDDPYDEIGAAIDLRFRA